METAFNLTEDALYKPPLYMKVMTGIACSLSILGSIAIILSYVCFKSTRNSAREIVLNLSLMDLMVACANLVGITIHYQLSSSSNWSTTSGKFCILQASCSLYGTLGSILWTNALAVYFYINVVIDNDKLKRYCVYCAYTVSYGLPLLIILWYNFTHKLGYYSRFSSWCTITDNNTAPGTIHFPLHMATFFGYNLWVYVSFILITATSVAVISYMRMAYNNLASVWFLVSFHTV